MKRIYKVLDNFMRYIAEGTSLLTFVFLVLITFMILRESLYIFKTISFFEFITEDQWRPVSNHPVFGIRNMILGTIYVSLIAICISVPISIGASIFISLHTKGKLKMILLAIIDLMVGIPSVVYGFFSFMTFVVFFERWLGFSTGESFLVAGVTLGIMVMPYMISSITQTMDKINNRYKQSADALGVSVDYMTLNLLLPASLRGVLSAVLMALSRALGETMAVLMVIGNSNLNPTLLGKGITIPGLITLEMGSAVVGSDHYHSLYASGFVLMIILFIINILFGFVKKSVDQYV